MAAPAPQSATRKRAGTASHWPAWYAPFGFILAAFVTLVGGVAVAGVAASTGAAPGTTTPATALTGTLIQDVALVAVAVLLAAAFGRPTAADFGLRPCAARKAAVLTAAALVTFYAVSAAYDRVVQPSGEQDIVDTLGAERGFGYLLGAATLVIVIAPFAEEIFFRGFFYRALRNRFNTAVAAGIAAVVFGSIHFSGADTLALLPVLALLGLLFCLLLEWTGSLYPAIILHSINNALAFGVTVDAEGATTVAVGAGAITVTVVVLLSVVQHQRDASHLVGASEGGGARA